MHVDDEGLDAYVTIGVIGLGLVSEMEFWICCLIIETEIVLRLINIYFEQ